MNCAIADLLGGDERGDQAAILWKRFIAEPENVDKLIALVGQAYARANRGAMAVDHGAAPAPLSNWTRGAPTVV